MEVQACAKPSHPAYITLFSILVVGAIAITVVAMISTLILSRSLTVNTLAQSTVLEGIAEACAEEALYQLYLDPDFSGTISLSSFEEGSCTFTILNGFGENRTLQIEAQYKSLVRRIQIEVDQLSPYVNTNEWEVVADF